MPSEIRQVIENSHLFAGLAPGLMDEIAASATKKTLGAHEVLFQKGDRADALWGVLSGRIVIEVRADDGKEMVLDEFHAGDVFGEVGVLDFGPRLVEATAACKSELFRLERSHFLEHLQTNPELCFRVFSLLCRHLRDTTETLEDTALYKLPSRLAKRLILMSNGTSSEDGRAVLNVVQSDLALMMGVHREAVNRQLREWEKSGWISIQRQRIEILEQKSLADLAAPGQNIHYRSWGNDRLSRLAPITFPTIAGLKTAPVQPEKRFAGILAVSCAEYAEMLMTDSANAVKRIKAGLAAIDRAIRDHGGQVVWSAGERTLAEFPDGASAIEAALEIQKKAGEAGPDAGQTDSIFRIGIHSGEVLASDGQFIGEPVNIAIRLTELPGSGGICFTGEVRDALEDTGNLELQYLGKHELKNVAHPVSVFSARPIPWLNRTALWADALVPRRYRPALAIAAMLLAVAVIWLGGERFGISHVPGPPAQSIAVMSFTLEGDSDNAYLADGLAGEIRTALAAMPETLVIGRHSSDYFVEWNATSQEIGEILGVAYVLQGTVSLTGDQLKVSSRLVETGDGTEIWQHNYLGSWRQFNEFQADIVRLTNETLAGGTAGSQSGVMAPPITENQKAHMLYLQARDLIYQRTGSSLRGALTKLKEALELDPEFALAHLAMAETYDHLYLSLDFYKNEPIQESRALMRPHLEKAVTIDENLAEAYVIQALFYDDRKSQQESYRKAIALNPNLASAHAALGGSLHDASYSWNEALPHLEKALSIEPLSIDLAVGLALSLSYIPSRRDEARAIVSNLKARHPDHPSVTNIEAHFLLADGRLAECIPLLEKTIAADPDNLLAVAGLNIVWFSLGEADRARGAPYRRPRHWWLVLSPDRDEMLRRLDAWKYAGPLEFDSRGLSSYIYLMLGDWQSAVDVMAHYPDDLEAFRKHCEMMCGKRDSAAMSLATAYKALGDDERYEKFAGIEKDAINTRSENGRIHNFEYSRTMARLYALEDRPDEAMIELERLITTGPIDPRDLMHPAFDEMRDLPGFRKLQEVQRQRVNVERAKLGLASIQGE